MLILNVFLFLGLTVGEVWPPRGNFDKEFLGTNFRLNPIEREKNLVLMRHKMNEITAGITGSKVFLPSKSFLLTKTDIEKSPVFKFIKGLPKGGALHNHFYSMATPDYLYNLTLLNNLYGSYLKGKFQYRFMNKPSNASVWKPFQQLRKDPKFDPWFKQQLTITDNPKSKLESLQFYIKPLLTYKPVFMKYFTHVLKLLYKDNVQYLEFRTELPELYELDGTVYSPVQTATILQSVVKTFLQEKPSFIGAKLIYAPLKTNSKATMRQYLKTSKSLNNVVGPFLAGFDLTGNVEFGKPLWSFTKYLTDIADVTKLLLHAGATKWDGTKEDMNLIDAVLLGSYRIGHANSITSNSELMKHIKKQKIVIEVSPIFDQVFGLVEDLRNHPGRYFLANKIPIVVGNEHSGMLGGHGLSSDWYLVFMGMTTVSADLGFLKQLASNSLEYSTLTDKEKTTAFDKWEENWNAWLHTKI